MQAHAISFPYLSRDARLINIPADRLGITIRKLANAGEVLFAEDVGLENKLRVPTFLEVLHATEPFGWSKSEQLLAMFSRIAGGNMIIASVRLVEDHGEKNLVVHHQLMWRGRD